MIVFSYIYWLNIPQRVEFIETAFYTPTSLIIMNTDKLRVTEYGTCQWVGYNRQQWSENLASLEGDLFGAAKIGNHEDLNNFDKGQIMMDR